MPDEWKYTSLNYHEDNQAMIDAKKGIIPKLDNNDPKYKNIDSETVATLLINHGILPPLEWMPGINANDN